MLSILLIALVPAILAISVASSVPMLGTMMAGILLGHVALFGTWPLLRLIPGYDWVLPRSVRVGGRVWPWGALLVVLLTELMAAPIVMGGDTLTAAMALAWLGAGKFLLIRAEVARAKREIRA